MDSLALREQQQQHPNGSTHAGGCALKRVRFATSQRRLGAFWSHCKEGATAVWPPRRAAHVRALARLAPLRPRTISRDVLKSNLEKLLRKSDLYAQILDAVQENENEAVTEGRWRKQVMRKAAENHRELLEKLKTK